MVSLLVATHISSRKTLPKADALAAGSGKLKMGLLSCRSGSGTSPRLGVFCPSLSLLSWRGGLIFLFHRQPVVPGYYQPFSFVTWKAMPFLPHWIGTHTGHSLIDLAWAGFPFPVHTVWAKGVASMIDRFGVHMQHSVKAVQSHRNGMQSGLKIGSFLFWNSSSIACLVFYMAS